MVENDLARRVLRRIDPAARERFFAAHPDLAYAQATGVFVFWPGQARPVELDWLCDERIQIEWPQTPQLWSDDDE